MAGGKTGITVQRNSTKDIIVSQPSPAGDNLYAWTDSTPLYAWTNTSLNLTVYTTMSNPSVTNFVGDSIILYDKNGNMLDYDFGNLWNGIKTADSNSIVVNTED